MQTLTAFEHARAEDLPRAIAVVGESPLALGAVRAWRERLSPVRVVIPGEDDRLSLAEIPLKGKESLLLRGGVKTLTEHDLPALQALTKTTRVIATGSAWGSPEVKEWWGSKSSSYRVYDSPRTTTPAARTKFEKWLREETELSQGIAKYVCQALGYDEFSVVEFARRAKFFVGSSMTSSNADVLMTDLRPSDMTELILCFQGLEALRVAETASKDALSAVFSELPPKIVLMSRMYGAVLRFPKPSVEASKEARIPLAQLSRYWQVASRYSPADTVYRLRLVSSLAETSPQDFSALCALVAMW